MPGKAQGVTASNNTIVGFTNPIYSTTAWAAYQASGIWTNHVATSVAGGDIVGAQRGSTTLYGAGTTEHLGGTANPTVFIGGAGRQWLLGGSGPNIFTYLSFSDSFPTHPDSINYFNPLKDVIDLSRIDANPAVPGVQNLTFRGNGSFTAAGGEVRIVQDAAHNITYVQATMAGGTYKAFQIDLAGLISLTAANFALTPAQSNLLHGDSTTYGSSGKVIELTAFLADGAKNVFGPPSRGNAGPLLSSTHVATSMALGQLIATPASSGTASSTHNAANLIQSTSLAASSMGEASALTFR